MTNISLIYFDEASYKEFLEKKQLKESSINTYIGVIRTFFIETSNLDIENIDTYNNFLVKYTIKKRCGYYYNIIRSYIDWKFSDDGKKKEELLKGLIKPTKRLDYKVERRYLEEDKLIEVVNNMQEMKHRIVSLVQMLTGVRAGDIMKLKEGSFFMEEYEHKPVLKMTILGKGNRRNVVFIHDEIAQQVIINYFATNVGERGYLFLTDSKYKGHKHLTGGEIRDDYKFYKMNYIWYHQDLKQALNKSHIDKTMFATHDFRRCFARRTWEKWKDINVLQSLLNHADPSTSLRYLEQSGLKNIDLQKEIQTGNK